MKAKSLSGYISGLAVAHQPLIDKEFLLYSNPVTGELTIRLAEEGNNEIIIYNLGGKAVFTKKFYGEFIRFRTNLNVGVYNLRLNSNGKTAFHKMIVQ
jgi:hypothetical protein